MARDIDVHHLLKSFASKNHLTEIRYSVFAQIVQRKAMNSDQTDPLFRELTLHPDTILIPKLFALSREKKVSIVANGTAIETIYLPEAFTDAIAAEYLRIEENGDIPFPNEESLHLSIPNEWIRAVSVEVDFPNLIDNSTETAVPIYRLVFHESLKSIVVLADSVDTKLLEYAVLKIRSYLRKGANKDYIQQRLLGAFPGKDRLLRETLNAILIRPYDIAQELKTVSSDFVYPFWAYLTTAIRKDLDGKKDYTPDEISASQASYIIDVYNNHYKSLAQRILERDTAFKLLQAMLIKPPYLFSIDDICDFRDIQSRPLLGKYTKEELETWIHNKTTEAEDGTLPFLLIINNSNHKKLISKDCFLTYVIKKLKEARDRIKPEIIKEWKEILIEYETIAQMNDDILFRKDLAKRLALSFPDLSAMIFSDYPYLVYNEFKGNSAPGELEKWFGNSTIATIDELLSLNRKELLSDTKMLLPFWYSLPFISWIMSLFHKKEKEKKKKKTPQQNTENNDKKAQASNQNNRAVEFKLAATNAESKLIPVGTTLENHMRSLIDKWNTMIDQTSKANLTEDINSLIRDYLRRSLRNMKPSEFSIERIEQIANDIASRPNLLKLRNHKALEEYICCYIIKSLKK